VFTAEEREYNNYTTTQHTATIHSYIQREREREAIIEMGSSHSPSYSSSLDGSVTPYSPCSPFDEAVAEYADVRSLFPHHLPWPPRWLAAHMALSSRMTGGDHGGGTLSSSAVAVSSAASSSVVAEILSRIPTRLSADSEEQREERSPTREVQQHPPQQKHNRDAAPPLAGGGEPEDVFLLVHLRFMKQKETIAGDDDDDGDESAVQGNHVVVLLGYTPAGGWTMLLQQKYSQHKAFNHLHSAGEYISSTQSGHDARRRELLSDPQHMFLAQPPCFESLCGLLLYYYQPL